MEYYLALKGEEIQTCCNLNKSRKILLRQIRQARRTNAERCHWYEIPKIVRSQGHSRMVVARGFKVGEMGSRCSVGTDFQFGR